MDKLFTDPKLAALMAAGSSMLQSSGPSRVPIGFGQALGSAFPAAQQAYTGAENAQYMRMAQQDKQRELLKKIEGDTLIKSLIEKQQSTGEPFNVKSFGQELIKSGNPYAIEVGMNYIKAAPKVKGMNKVMVDGQALFQPYFDDGTFGATSDRPAAEKLMQINRGNQIDLANPYTGQSQTSLSMGMAPGESARLAQSDRHFGMSHGLAQQNAALARENAAFSRQQAVKPQYKDGYWITPPNANNPQGAMIPTDLATAPKGSQAEKTRMSERIKNTLGDDTEKLIREATGSFIGNIRDKSASAFGITTDPAKANATLKLRASTLAGNMPRFEGPQSDADRQYYLEMAGDLANPNKTTQEKLMALQELRRIHNLAGKDGVVNSGGGGGSSDGWGELE